MADQTMSAPSRPAADLTPDGCLRLVRGLRGCGLVLVDGSGRVHLWSPGAAALFGHSPSDLVGASIAVLQPPDDGRTGWPAAQLMGLPDGAVAEEERWLRHKDGHAIRTALTWCRGDEEGPVYALLLQDATRRWRSEEEGRERLAREEAGRQRAEGAIQAREEFLAVLSHELRTPLTAIVGWAHLLRTGKLDEENRERAVEIIERNARAEAELTTDILDVSRIITGKLRLELQDVEAFTVVAAAVEAARPDARRKVVDLEMDAPGGAGSVRGDPARLQQAIGKLLSNAVKFTPAGGRVRVSLRREGDALEMRVEDTGAGIPADVLPTLFDRLWQGGGSRTGGLGVGLAIARHLVELHGGTLAAASEGPGRGSAFTLRLPAFDKESRPGSATSRCG